MGRMTNGSFTENILANQLLRLPFIWNTLYIFMLFLWFIQYYNCSWVEKYCFFNNTNTPPATHGIELLRVESSPFNFWRWPSLIHKTSICCQCLHRVQYRILFSNASLLLSANFRQLSCGIGNTIVVARAETRTAICRQTPQLPNYRLHHSRGSFPHFTINTSNCKLNLERVQSS